MPQLIDGPHQIPVPGNKIIDEYAGRVNTGESQVSIAHMRSPAGWSEPGQRPDFDEFTVVLNGVLHVEYEEEAGSRAKPVSQQGELPADASALPASRRGALDVSGGQAIVARKGEWV